MVGVDPGQQGGGLGRALTQTGLAHLRRLGLAEVMLYVDEDNTAAVKMYTALGFGRWSTDVDVPAPGALGTRGSSAVRSSAVAGAQPERGVKLALRQWPVARRRHGREHVGIEFDLVKRHVVVHTQINPHGNRNPLPIGLAGR